MQGLEGLRVLELGHMVSAAYATKLMADLGADVVKVEEPQGDRARWRGPFPQGIPDYEITMAHGGGWAWLSPTGSERPDLSPLKAFGHQADFQGELAAALTSLASYYRALETGVDIDLSVQEYIASFLEQNFIYYTYQGRIASRLGKRLLYPWGMFACQDGLIFLAVVEEDQWQRLVAMMGNPKRAQWFKDGFSRGENQDVLKLYLEEWIREGKVEDLFWAGQERRICFAPAFTLAQLAEQKQLRSRNVFVSVPHPRAGTLTHIGPPYQLREPWWKICRPAPLLGEHNQEVWGFLSALGEAQTPNPQPPPSRLPLEGVRVADFSLVWAGHFCTLQLAPHNAFRCAGADEWVTIACGTEQEWSSFCQATGQPELAQDPRFATLQNRKAHEEELESIISNWTQKHDKWEVTRILQSFPSMSSKDLAEDRHLNERGFFARLLHPEVGIRTHTGIPWRLTHAPNGVRSPAPLLGQDTDQVLQDLLGYSVEEISQLKEGGKICRFDRSPLKESSCY